METWEVESNQSPGNAFPPHLKQTVPCTPRQGSHSWRAGLGTIGKLGGERIQSEPSPHQYFTFPVIKKWKSEGFGTQTDRLLHRLNIVLCSHKHQEKKFCNIFSSKIITLCIYFYITTIYKKPLPESELWGHNLQKTLQHLSERLEVLLKKKIHIFSAKFSVFHVLHSYLLRHNHTCLWLIRIQPLDQA